MINFKHYVDDLFQQFIMIDMKTDMITSELKLALNSINLLFKHILNGGYGLNIKPECNENH